MAAPRDIEVKLSIDTSKFVEAINAAADMNRTMRKVREAFGRVTLDSLKEWLRVQLSRDTRQVPCHGYDHEVRFTLCPSEACPGCGAAL